MKKFLMLFLILSIINLVAFAENEHPIDIRLQKCMERDYSTAGMNKCTYAARDEWKKEIDKSMKLIKRKVSAEKYSHLIASQDKWNEYYKAENETIRELIFNKQGTMYTNIAVGTSLEIVKQRAKALNAYYYYNKDIAD